MAECITKKQVIEWFRPYGHADECIPFSTLKTDVMGMPAADVAPVVYGRWEQDADGDWYCTHCNEYACICDSGKERTYRKPYCPNCGAKMQVRDE